jgi:hypothetical protein
MERLRVVTHVFLDDEPRLPNRRAVREALHPSIFSFSAVGSLNTGNESLNVKGAAKAF